MGILHAVVFALFSSSFLLFFAFVVVLYSKVNC
jgi:hypothetical protein